MTPLSLKDLPGQNQNYEYRVKTERGEELVVVSEPKIALAKLEAKRLGLDGKYWEFKLLRRP